MLPAKLRRFSILILTAIGLSGCPGGEDGRPPIDLKIYGADVEHHGIIRKEHGKIDFIGCYEEKFQDYICIHVDEVKKIDAYLNRCEKWK